MPEVEIPIEKWTGTVKEVKLGGGGRKEVVVGGETTLPFLSFEGSIPNPPKVAIEVHDREPSGWPSLLLSAWGDAVKDPGTWAKKAVEFGADIIALKLLSAHPEGGDTGAAEAKATVDKVLSAVDLPLIVIGPGVAEKDNEVLTAVAEAARGQRVALGNCEEKNYRTIAAVCISDGHIAIAKTPLDINLCKQLNIMLSDIGVQMDSIIMDPDTGALGYGIEYGYSINERLRLAALGGDAMTALPIINYAGWETWRQKEARASEGVPAAWGDLEERAVIWEEVTTSSVINAGCDIVVMCHPKAIDRIKSTIDRLMGK
ncbi:MAG: acetyl-CoA decarbonylase/synthase complex subunit delta [Dehalococcoidia bacterium]|nr:MAG: acetyl-CoA decarbonylase/synthase complex subunit delta [Dehalococcoidia bacterium]